MAPSTFLATPVRRPLPLFLVTGLAALLAHRAGPPARPTAPVNPAESVQKAA